MTDYIKRGATISDCGLYRYNLHRRWATEGPTCAFIMLNPSTADAEVDDPTIRKCVAFATSFGCGALQVLNLFAFRATDPKAMLRAADPVGPTNHRIVKLIAGGIDGPIICAWGTHGGHRGQDRRMLDWLRESGATPMALRVTKDGFPSHPLYLPAACRPEPYTKGADHG